MERLKRISFIIALIGIFALLLFSIFEKPLIVSSYSDLKEGDYVRTFSSILSIRNYSDFFIIELENNITLICNNCEQEKNSSIIVEGKVEKYKELLEINVWKIKKLESF